MSGEVWLEALELPVQPPSLPYLRELFRAFNERIPFESASKIVRDREIVEASEKPRRPDLFWGEHLERGTGGTCFARVAAFEALLVDLGFPSRRVIGAIGSARNHASLAVRLAGQEWLADVGYPLPEIFPFASAEYETPLGMLRMDVAENAAAVRFESGPERGRSIRFELGSQADADFEDSWRRTFVRTSMFLSDVVIRRETGDRVLRFHRGEIQISDAVSRTRIPLGTKRAERLSEIFEIDQGILERALELTGDPNPAREAARIEVFREGEDAEELLKAIARPDGYRRFAEGLGKVEIESTGERTFEARIAPERGDPAVERVRYEPEQNILTIEREVGLRSTGFQVETTEFGPRLVRFADLPDAREEFLRSDFGRGRIAAILAMDLAALSRL